MTQEELDNMIFGNKVKLEQDVINQIDHLKVFIDNDSNPKYMSADPIALAFAKQQYEILIKYRDSLHEQIEWLKSMTPKIEEK